MKESLIRFSVPVVRVQLDGSKTHTRRALRQQLVWAASFKPTNAVQEGKAS